MRPKIRRGFSTLSCGWANQAAKEALAVEELLQRYWESLPPGARVTQPESTFAQLVYFLDQIEASLYPIRQDILQEAVRKATGALELLEKYWALEPPPFGP